MNQMEVGEEAGREKKDGHIIVDDGKGGNRSNIH